MTVSAVLDKANRYWRDLTVRIVLPESARESVFAAYSEPHRRYHSLDHIVEMLDCLEESRRFAASPDTVALAIWYHDVIYEPDAPPAWNEEASADLLAAHYSGAESAAAQAIIRHSAHHGPSKDRDTQLFCDIDLYRLGVAYEDFLGHSRDVRAEYGHVSDADWARGRGEFFRGLLARAPLYQTTFWRDRLEAQARDNIARTIANLNAG